MEHHGILDSLKHLVVDEEEKTVVSNTVPSAPPPAVPVVSFANTAGVALYQAPSTGSPAGLSSLVDAATPATAEADNFYQKLLGKTDFDKTDVAVAIQKFAAPLEGIITDGQLRFRTAVAQAQAQAGITADAILAVFDQLKDKLTEGEDGFRRSEAAFKDHEIDARSKRLDVIQQQIAALQDEQTKTANELAEAQAKAARVSSGFNSALQRRTSEIDAQKAKYAALLQLK